MKEIVSVIVPVYNVEAYLAECVESLLVQTHKDLEIILIDDGSTDNSGKLCDAYAARDGRIRVIHQKNGGAAAAKNAGLRIATGTYLTFLDSDDYVEPDAYAHMIALMHQHGADVVQCGMRNFYADGSQEYIAPSAPAVFGPEEYMLRYTTDWTCGLMTDKLFRRSLFEGIFFVEGNKIDDEFFTYRGVMNAGKIAQDPKVVYHYRQRGSSVMLNPASGQRIVMDKLSYLSIRRKAVAERFPTLRRAFDLHYLDMLLLLSKDPYASQDSLTREKQLLREYIWEKKPTIPSPGIVRKLLCLYTTPNQKLLQKRRPLPDHIVKAFFP